MREKKSKLYGGVSKLLVINHLIGSLINLLIYYEIPAKFADLLLCADSIFICLTMHDTNDNNLINFH